MSQVTHDIEHSLTALGIEFGSTRIKAVLVDSKQVPIASGSYEWENQLVDGIWTYDLDAVWTGLQGAYADLVADVAAKYDIKLTKVGSFGISAMMHGYMSFDVDDQLLVPFRTWRNTMTGQAAEELSQCFHFNIPERWSIAHLYQAILNQESHVPEINYLTTLAGYVHWRLTGERVLGVGDASGMFPIDPKLGTYRSDFLDSFAQLISPQNLPWTLEQILPKVLRAGQDAGRLTEEGAKLLDPSGQLEAGSPLCPPEGDAGTGMVATNSIAPRTGNVSAGTSIFSMIVLEEDLKNRYAEIDIVTTPVGDSVAMVHANNCSSDINACVKLFHEFSQLSGQGISMEDAYQVLFNSALTAEKDGGHLLSIGYYSGESITGIDEGRPLLVRTPESHLTVGNLMRSHILSAFATLSLGMDILTQEEKIVIDRILGHGGIFKTPKVAQSLLAAAIESPVSVMETAGEGGAWGIALLADYLNHSELSLAAYLNSKVFASVETETIVPDKADIDGFNHFMTAYRAGLKLEKLAVEVIR
ncbi:xylulokinase [Streptococcus merionis]|uniref:xylulokinase n=1 Tax=Streptococcus merionis TaxID=400065 RepID=UPI003517B700